MNSSESRPSEPPIFFIHIPKTGGNTVVSHLLAFMPVDRVYPPPPELTLLDTQLAEARAVLPRLRFLHGHTQNKVAEQLPLDQMRLVTFIRHPVRLVVSHYLHFRYAPELGMHRAAKEFGIAEFIRRYPSFGTNPQARYLSRTCGLLVPSGPGETMDMVGRGLAALDRMAFVGITERMTESLQAMSESFGLPFFEVGRHNEGRASRDEVQACEAVLRQDEFLMRLGADHAMRLEAERRLDNIQLEKRIAAIRAALVAGLQGNRPMPWVLARDGQAAVTFLDGWFPQSWLGKPAVETDHWWTRERPRLLVASLDHRPLLLRMKVIQTLAFAPGEIKAQFGRHICAPAVESNPDGTAVLTWRIDAPTLRQNDGVVAVTLKAPRLRSFADLDPALNDFDLRGFAAREITVLPTED